MPNTLRPARCIVFCNQSALAVFVGEAHPRTALTLSVDFTSTIVVGLMHTTLRPLKALPLDVIMEGAAWRRLALVASRPCGSSTHSKPRPIINLAKSGNPSSYLCDELLIEDSNLCSLHALRCATLRTTNRTNS